MLDKLKEIARVRRQRKELEHLKKLLEPKRRPRPAKKTVAKR